MEVRVGGAAYDESIGSYPGPLRSAGVTPYDLVDGHAHHVHAMALFGTGLHVLVVTPSLRVSWAPLEYFHVTDARLSTAWQFRSFDRTVGMRAVWGYPAMPEVEDHSDDLTVERRRRAERVFLEQCSRAGLSDSEVERLHQLAALVGIPAGEVG